MKCMNVQDADKMFIQVVILKLDVITNERN
jgi:hypothetical protein